MNDFSQPKTARNVLRAVLIGLLIGATFSALVIASLQSDFVQQKFMSLRYRVIGLLPQSAEPQFVPTPLAVPTQLASATPSPTIAPSFDDAQDKPTDPTTPTRAPIPPRAPSRTPTALPADVAPIQPSVALRAIKPDYQRWNNCGPTTLGMALQ